MYLNPSTKSLTLKAGYNRRIQRPGIVLNPNVKRSESYQYLVGNPTLDPELLDNFEVCRVLI